jgi:hypothetical protein
MENKLYTKEEWDILVQTLDEIGAYLPENKTGYIWSNFAKVAGNVGPQPCSCASSAGHWRRAIDTLREYVKTNSEYYV